MASSVERADGDGEMASVDNNEDKALLEDGFVTVLHGVLLHSLSLVLGAAIGASLMIILSLFRCH